MNVHQLKRLCRTCPGATETLYREPSNFLVYQIGGKKFAYFKTSEPERWRFSIRVSSDRFVELTDVGGVKPARYRGRYGWITIVKVHKFPEAYLIELVEWSYQKALVSLSRSKQIHAGIVERTSPKRGQLVRAKFVSQCGKDPGYRRNS